MARVDENVDRTWTVPASVADAVHEHAARLACHDSAIVGQLLAFALGELAAGRLTPRRRPMLYELVGLERRDETSTLKLGND